MQPDGRIVPSIEVMRILVVALISSGAAWSAAKPAGKPVTVAFEPNRGQSRTGGDFVAYGDGYALSLQRGRAELISGKTHVATVLAGVKGSARAEGESQLPGVVNYLKANERSGWITGVPTYSRVRYRAVYPGVDLVYYGNSGKLEYDFVVAPGADAHAINLRYEGARSLRLDASGDLIVDTAGGDLRQHRPVVYQEIDGARHEIAGNYVLRGKAVRFALAEYDRTRELVIDPVLTWSTFVDYSGAPGTSTGEGVAADSSGNLYMVGSALNTAGYFDTLVSKLSPSGANIFTTHFTGSYNYLGHAVAVDSGGNMYVVGEVTATGVIQTGFVAKINSGGTAVAFSFNWGGSGGDAAYGIALDSSTNIYICGATASTDFPVNAGAAQTRLGGGVDGFVTKFDPNGNGLYSTYLGGTGSDTAWAIAVDSSGDAFVTGSTASTNFPVTTGSFQTTSGGSGDAFITKLSPTLTTVFSTYLGGSGTDVGYAIAVDAGGVIYVTGETASTNFPTLGAFQSSFGGGNGDVFLTKMNGNGQTLAYSTYLGGSGEDVAFGLAVDTSGNAYVTGSTNSTDFPLSKAFQSANQGSINAIVAAVDSTGANLLFSSYLGGNGSPGTGGDYGNAVTVNCSSGLVVTGTTASANFPTTSGAFLSAYPGGTYNAFMTKVGAGPSTPAISTGGVIGTWSPAVGPVAPGSLLSIYGTGFAASENVSSVLPLPTNVAGTTVNINGNVVPILYSSPTQMNVQVPYETVPGAAVVTVSNSCGSSQPIIFQVAQVYPYILQGATGDAVAFNQDSTLNSPGNPAAAGTVVTLFLTGIGPVNPSVPTGAGANGPPSLSVATLPKSATIGGWDSPVGYLGLTPNTVIAQANLTVPGLSTGGYAVVLTVGGVASNGPKLYIK